LESGGSSAGDRIHARDIWIGFLSDNDNNNERPCIRSQCLAQVVDEKVVRTPVISIIIRHLAKAKYVAILVTHP
jgi:hypothetical protein